MRKELKYKEKNYREFSRNVKETGGNCSQRFVIAPPCHSLQKGAPPWRGDASDRESGFVLAFLDSGFCGNDKKEAVSSYNRRGRAVWKGDSEKKSAF
jgi:hypothetical protein